MIYRAIAKLPFKLLYIISSSAAFLLFHVMRYRRNVSYNNLSRAFPEKSHSEIKRMQKATYQCLTDSFLEIIKSYNMSDEEVLTRVELINFDEIEKHSAQNQPVFFLTAHTAPTEWVAHALHAQYGCIIDPVYKPTHAKNLDRFIFAVRSRHQGTPIPYKELAKDVVRRKTVNRSIAVLADLEPRSRDQALVIDFLNQPTRFFLGSERVVKLANMPTFFIGVKRVRRGHYQAFAQKLSDQPKQMPAEELTRKYARCVEEIVSEQPTAWLWTHKRWKKKSRSVS